MTTARADARRPAQLTLSAAAAALSGRRLRTGQPIGEGRFVAAIPRLALTPAEAAAALGMGLTSFKKYVQPHVRVVRRGKLRVIPIGELERWAEENAEDLFDVGPRDRFSDSGRM